MPPIRLSTHPPIHLFLWQWVREPRNESRARLLADAIVADRARRLGPCRRRLVDREAADDLPDLVPVEDLAREQLVGQPLEPFAIRLQELQRTLVVLRDDPLDLLVDADRGVLAVVRPLRDLAAEEDLLFLLAERERA